MDKFGIDDHKIHYHLDRVQDWLHKTKTIYPIYIEISPSGACNHRCTFCAVDYIGYKPRLLDKTLLKARIAEMAEKGVKSIMFAGEGEPLVHKDLAEIIAHTHKAGIDAAITTNAVLLNDKFVQAALPHTTWIKASVNAGSPETYAKIHQTKPEDFNTVIANLKHAAAVRGRLSSPCALGAQMVLLPENAHEAYPLGEICKDAGIDYLVIKPYSQHNMSVTHAYEGIHYDRLMTMADELEKLNGDKFQIVFRRQTMENLAESERYYKVCQATPFFWAYIMASGDLYGCSAYLEDKRFCYGNILQNTFTEIWEGEKRRQSIDYVERELDINECRKNCRMDKVNRYLWDLKHPREHVNFI